MENVNFRGFQDAGQAVLQYLHQHLGFSLWMITRVEGQDWIVLQSEDHSYDVYPGQVLQSGRTLFVCIWWRVRLLKLRLALKIFLYMPLRQLTNSCESSLISVSHS